MIKIKTDAGGLTRLAAKGATLRRGLDAWVDDVRKLTGGGLRAEVSKAYRRRTGRLETAARDIGRSADVRSRGAEVRVEMEISDPPYAVVLDRATRFRGHGYVGRAVDRLRAPLLESAEKHLARHLE